MEQTDASLELPWFGGGRKLGGLEDWDEEEAHSAKPMSLGVLAKVVPSAWRVDAAASGKGKSDEMVRVHTKLQRERERERERERREID